MQQYRKNLGKVSLTAEGAWDGTKAFDILSIVYDEHTQHGFISRKAVPEGVDLYNKEYWMPLNVSGYADNNVIILSKKINEASIQSYTLKEAIASIKSVGRRPGAILGFYNENNDRLDIGGRWELWQFNDTNVYNWENVDSWQNLYYNYNKFMGWFKDENFLNKYAPFPEIGCYAFVGSEFNEATVYRCDNKYVWNNTTQHAWDYVKVVVDGNVTVGENGNWFNNGEDTGIPASVKGENGKTPIFREKDNTIQYSFDNVNWITISDKVAAWFRWKATIGDTQANNVGRIQISRDNVIWTDLSGDIINNLHISRYMGVDESLPTSGIAEGTIYAKGPTYADEDTNHNNPIYRIWVYAWKNNTLAWQDNGEFTSIAAGVVQELGDSETKVISQKGILNNVFNKKIISSNIHYRSGYYTIDNNKLNLVADNNVGHSIPYRILSNYAVLEITNIIYSGYIGFFILDKDFNVLSTETGTGSVMKYTITNIPKDAYYIIFNYVITERDKCEFAVYNKEPYIESSYILYDLATDENNDWRKHGGYAMTEFGQVVAANTSYTDKIKINPLTDKYLFISTHTNGGEYKVLFYDSTDNVIETHTSFNNSMYDLIITDIPINASYIILNVIFNQSWANPATYKCQVYKEVKSYISEVTSEIHDELYDIDYDKVKYSVKVPYGATETTSQYLNDVIQIIQNNKYLIIGTGDLINSEQIKVNKGTPAVILLDSNYKSIAYVSIPLGVAILKLSDYDKFEEAVYYTIKLSYSPADSSTYANYFIYRFKDNTGLVKLLTFINDTKENKKESTNILDFPNKVKIQSSYSNSKEFDINNKSTLNPIPFDKIVINPDSILGRLGWYGDKKLTDLFEWLDIYNKDANIGGYVRPSWRMLESYKGQYDFSFIDVALKTCAENNVRLTYRISPYNGASYEPLYVSKPMEYTSEVYDDLLTNAYGNFEWDEYDRLKVYNSSNNTYYLVSRGFPNYCFWEALIEGKHCVLDFNTASAFACTAAINYDSDAFFNNWHNLNVAHYNWLCEQVEVNINGEIKNVIRKNIVENFQCYAVGIYGEGSTVNFTNPNSMIRYADDSVSIYHDIPISFPISLIRQHNLYGNSALTTLLNYKNDLGYTGLYLDIIGTGYYLNSDYLATPADKILKNTINSRRWCGEGGGTIDTFNQLSLLDHAYKFHFSGVSTHNFSIKESEPIGKSQIEKFISLAGAKILISNVSINNNTISLNIQNIGFCKVFSPYWTTKYIYRDINNNYLGEEDAGFNIQDINPNSYNYEDIGYITTGLTYTKELNIPTKTANIFIAIKDIYGIYKNYYLYNRGRNNNGEYCLISL